MIDHSMSWSSNRNEEVSSPVPEVPRLRSLYKLRCRAKCNEEEESVKNAMNKCNAKKVMLLEYNGTTQRKRSCASMMMMVMTIGNRASKRRKS